MRLIYIISIFILFHASSFSQPVINLELYATGFDDPVDIANAGDGRLFIVERKGIIRIIDESGETLAADFLNIADKIESGYDEQGLLGLAFAPDYASSGYFFVYYTDNDNHDIVERYTVSADPDSADEASGQIIFSADDPYVNHNAGDLNFGPDGYFYFGMGDGGSAGDPGNRAQNAMEKLGKIHRINVTGVDTYTIPADNPYAGSLDTLESIWDIGVRNPWRFSFDRLTGEMWLADVGQNLYEEVNLEPAGSGGGFNYGWRCYEADEDFSTSGCESSSYYTFPIFNYSHSFSTGGFAIVGGFVYRGEMYPGMYGYYICGDEVSGNWWTIKPNGSGGWMTQFISGLTSSVSTFGEAVNGEIYCAELTSGKIFHVTDICAAFSVTISSDSTTLTASDGISWQWYKDGELITGATDQEYSPEASGTYTVEASFANGCNVFSEGVDFIFLSADLPVFIQSIHIYPNPATDKLLVGINSAENMADAVLQIRDITGTIIFTVNVNIISGNFEKYIPVDNLPGGMYNLTLKANTINWNANFIVTR